jgi:small subunit ribosomal protein S6
VRHYEVMIILDPSLDDESLQVAIDRATEAITANGGSVEKIDRWGKRRFAYEVHHRSEGYYVLIEARAEPSALAQLDRALGLSDDVIRHKVIKVPAGSTAKAVNPPNPDDPPQAVTNVNGDDKPCPTETTSASSAT